MIRNYLKEEEFVEEFTDWSYQAASAVNSAWQPNPDANDGDRANNKHFLEAGQLEALVFSSASTHRLRNGGIKVAIILESSFKVVCVEVGESEAPQVNVCIVRVWPNQVSQV